MESKVNALGVAKRSIPEMKRKIIDLRSRTKQKALTQHKQTINKTGGGQMKPVILTHEEHVVLELIGPESIQGIPGAPPVIQFPCTMESTKLLEIPPSTSGNKDAQLIENELPTKFLEITACTSRDAIETQTEQSNENKLPTRQQRSGVVKGKKKSK